MTKQNKYTVWVDRYVRDQLSEEELRVFEEQLLEDSQLQIEVRAVGAIKTALKLDRDLESDTSQLAAISPARNQWPIMAIAASVLLAIVSTTFYWRSSAEAGHLQQQLEALQAPRTMVMNVPVNIIRTTGGTTPGVIVEKPAGQSIIILDIELPIRFRSLDSIEFQLQAIDSDEILSWAAAPTAPGWVSVSLISEVVPDGMVYLHISDTAGDLQESRLLEFR